MSVGELEAGASSTVLAPQPASGGLNRKMTSKGFLSLDEILVEYI